ncbi:MAG: hypothetical protein DCC71_03725 [Proteobacteria bacterium]|nr:MAG: hypothetical protein DCC71_03725 [Pseudomonadota bacterium]
MRCIAGFVRRWNRCQVLEGVVALDADAIAGCETIDHLDVAVVGDAQYERAPLEPIRPIIALYERKEAPRLSENRALRNCQRLLGATRHEAERCAHVRAKLPGRIENPDVHGERPVRRLQRPAHTLHHSLEGLRRIARNADAHVLADGDLADLTFEDASDGQDLR